MPCIPGTDWDCNPIDDLIEGGIQDALDDLAKDMVETATWALKALVTGWLDTSSPLLTDNVVVSDLRAYTYWAVAALAVFSLLVSAGRLVLERNGRAATDMLTGLVKLVLVSSLLVPAVVLLDEIGSGYATWIVNAAAGPDLGALVLNLTTAATSSQITAVGLISVAAICILILLAQILISIAVGGLKIILVGVAPVAAAAGVSGAGRSTLARYLSWLSATLLFKPVAATIYAAAFWLIAEDSTIEGTMTGLVVLSMAVLTMPALLRLLAPITSQVSGANGAGIAAAAVGGAAALATGAIKLSGGGSRPPGGPGPQPPAGPENSSGASPQAQIGGRTSPQVSGRDNSSVSGTTPPPAISGGGGGQGPGPQGPQPSPAPAGGPGGGPVPQPAAAVAAGAGAGAAAAVVHRAGEIASGSTPPPEGQQ